MIAAVLVTLDFQGYYYGQNHSNHLKTFHIYDTIRKLGCGHLVPPVAMMSPGAESLDKMGILLSWMLNSWLQRWAKWREQPLLS